MFGEEVRMDETYNPDGRMLVERKRKKTEFQTDFCLDSASYPVHRMKILIETVENQISDDCMPKIPL